MKANLISMNILVDSSGSMESIASDMVGALNQLVDENRDLDVLVTYSIFSNKYQPVFSGKPIKEVERFDLKPDANTALIESACRMIDEVGARLGAMPEDERPEKVMFVIITDGLENASAPEYTKERLLAKIKEQTEVYNWGFLYLGADQDAIAVARSYGIDGTWAVEYERASSRKSGAVLSEKLREMSKARREQILRAIAFSDEDRAALEGQGD